MESEQIVMSLILHSGDAKNHMYMALHHAKEAAYEEVEKEIALADAAINEAHTVQTVFLQQEASGNSIAITGLFVHAQDHLMTTMTEMNLIKEMIELRSIVNTLK